MLLTLWVPLASKLVTLLRYSNYPPSHIYDARLPIEGSYGYINTLFFSWRSLGLSIKANRINAIMREVSVIMLSSRTLRWQLTLTAIKVSNLFY